MKLDLKNLPTLLAAKLQALGRYKVIVFIVFVAGLYVYLVLQINSATGVQPSNSSPATAQAAAHVDPMVVSKIKQLQDNSVGVKALFNQSRSNPFQQ